MVLVTTVNCGATKSLSCKFNALRTLNSLYETLHTFVRSAPPLKKQESTRAQSVGRQRNPLTPQIRQYYQKASVATRLETTAPEGEVTVKELLLARRVKPSLLKSRNS